MWIDIINIYPFQNYQFSAKGGKPEKDSSKRSRLARLEKNYDRDGMRRTVEAVLLLHKQKHPHLILLRRKSTGVLDLPGGRAKRGEAEVQCLKRKLTSLLASPGDQHDWKIKECIGIWWRTAFDKEFSCYLDGELKPKECRWIFLVQLKKGLNFAVPANFELVIKPFATIDDNSAMCGQILSSIPAQLSRYRLSYSELNDTATQSTESRE